MRRRISAALVCGTPATAKVPRVGAVRPEHAEDLALRGLEAEIGHRHERAVALLDSIHLDGRAHEPLRNDTSSFRSLPPLTVCSRTVPIPRA